MAKKKNIGKLFKDFFGDVKGPLALLAVIISVISLYATISNQAEQNRRWEALNLGRIDLTDESFTMFKELSKEELGQTCYTLYTNLHR